jgi:hypothetical protein
VYFYDYNYHTTTTTSQQATATAREENCGVKCKDLNSSVMNVMCAAAMAIIQYSADRVPVQDAKCQNSENVNTAATATSKRQFQNFFSTA